MTHKLDRYLQVRGTNFDADTWNDKFIDQYCKIVPCSFNRGKILDVGAGNWGFVRACAGRGFEAHGIDHEIDLENGKFPFRSGYFDYVHVNAVIEHLANPDNMLSEAHRVLVRNGIIIINTPNWALDFKNFYNDPTHKRPYTPESLKMLMNMFNFSVLLCEPALIVRSPLWWNLPFKWRVCSWLPKGSKSILLVGRRINED